MSSPVPRPAKRTRQRQACEPCRRKKTRCPGEKPVCSFCARLGQFCVYADELIHQSSGNPTANREPRSEAESFQRLESRVQVLEARLAEVMGIVRGGQQQSLDHIADQSPPTVVAHIVSSPIPENAAAQLLTGILPRWDMVIAATELYLSYCDCQPLPLFQRDSLIVDLRRRDPEVIFSILALAIRFSDNTLFRDNLVDLTNGYAETARKMVMRRVLEGPVELSTLQSLCLLSLVEFTNGNKHRASIHSSLAMNLAHCAGLTSESSLEFSDVVREERRRCFWSIFLLKRLHGADFSVLDFSGEDNFPWYPTSTGSPSVEGSGIERDFSPSLSSEAARNSQKDAGIIAYAIQLSEVWFKTTKYARRRSTPSKLPPWSPQSEYATIVAQQMEFETRMPYIHRFKPAAFSEKPSDELQRNRDYWGPWLFIQFLYHTNLCLLNHPLILALRLRNFQNTIPEIFLQNTSDLISSHASWIIHLINIVNAKSFQVTDPFLGHCAAIAATIHLQESFVEDMEVRKEKQVHFAKCLEFIRECGQKWPHITRLADKLQQLQNTVSASYNHRSINSQIPTRSLLIDLARLWEILEYSSAGELYDSAGQLFGPSLYFGPHNSTTEVSKTSTLPPPTRLGSTDVSPRQGADGSTPRASNESLDRGMLESISRGEVPLTAFPYGNFADQSYSNDELAVLADSFFNQRQDFSGDVDDWWRAGNL